MLFSGLWAVMLNNRAKKDSQKVLDNLDIHVGNTIADIGSGGGYFTFELAKRTGRNGTVFAVDTNEKLLARIERLALKNGMANVKTVLCGEDGCPLQKECCDLIFMRNVFHHIKDSAPYFRRLRESIKPGGRIAILDWKESAGGYVGRSGHCAQEGDIIRALRQAGFTHLKSIDVLESQTYNMFLKESDSN